MGSCLCKKKTQVQLVTVYRSQSTMSENESNAKRPRIVDETPIEPLIIEILRFIGTVTQNSQENMITPINRIQCLADTEDGWCRVISSLIRTIPLYDPLGPSAITIVLDEIPLPSTETLLGFIRSLDITRARCPDAYRDDNTICYERNLLVMLGCFADKFAGPHSVMILTDDVLSYLIQFLVDERNPQLVLHALIALEKFAGTTENKMRIELAFGKMLLHPLLPLSLHSDTHVYAWREVGFNARWALDNIFLINGRRLTYETVNMEAINVTVNHDDMSQYIKLSSDGLEARSDSHSFESIRGTFEINSKAWYYEVEIMTAGVMQIGWATLRADFKNLEGFGVGDDAFSLAYDGCRRLIWHKAEPTPTFAVPTWQVGDILGCLIDVDRQEAIFSLNGQRLDPCRDIFANSRVQWLYEQGICSEGFYAAASFMAHQQCRFNFGHKRFEFPPTDRDYNIMNDYGFIEMEDKKVIPRRVAAIGNAIGGTDDKEVNKRCTICLDVVGNYGVDPCDHRGFCFNCVRKLPKCPLCRVPISEFFILAL